MARIRRMNTDFLMYTKSVFIRMNISYHEAQMKLDEMETGLGYKLVTITPVSCSYPAILM